MSTKALLWKDCRVNLFVLIFGLAMLLGPFLVWLAGVLYDYWRYGAHVWRPETCQIMGITSLSLSLLTIAMLGGNAVASERSDRSAEFLAYLPPSRWTVITSKIILAVGACLFIWVVNLVVIRWIAPLMSVQGSSVAGSHPANAVSSLACTSIILFGVAWMCSSFTASPAIATGAGIFSAPLVIGSLHVVDLLDDSATFDILWWYGAICVTLGILSFAGGTWYYLRRVEP